MLNHILAVAKGLLHDGLCTSQATGRIIYLMWSQYSEHHVTLLHYEYDFLECITFVGMSDISCQLLWYIVTKCGLNYPFDEITLLSFSVSWKVSSSVCIQGFLYPSLGLPFGSLAG